LFARKHPQSKLVQLLEMESGEFAIEGIVTVQLAPNPKRGLEYVVYLAVDGYHPEMDGKSLLMKVGNYSDARTTLSSRFARGSGCTFGNPGEVSLKMIGDAMLQSPWIEMGVSSLGSECYAWSQRNATSPERQAPDLKSS
jgi:hypothetical protein